MDAVVAESAESELLWTDLSDVGDCLVLVG